MFEALKVHNAHMLLACTSDARIHCEGDEKNCKRLSWAQTKSGRRIRIGARERLFSLIRTWKLNCICQTRHKFVCERDTYAFGLVRAIFQQFIVCLFIFSAWSVHCFTWIFVFCFSYLKFTMANCVTGEFKKGDTINFCSVLAVAPST